MAITSERFMQGLTIEQYKAQMTRNQEAFQTNEEQTIIRPSDHEFFARLSQPINVVVLAEDWCGDVIANVPVLAKLAKETGKLNLRIFPRDQNLDLADQYLKEGKFRSIPVFVFFDQQMHELGHFIERPARATAEMGAVRQRLAAEYPELADPEKSLEHLSEETRKAYLAETRKLREERKQAWNEMLLDEIEAILSQTAAV